MKRSTVILTIMTATFTMCVKNADNYDNKSSSLLNGENYIFEVSRISNMPDVNLPGDNLQESDYTFTGEQIQYTVTFSENFQTVTIEPGPIRGRKIIEDKDSKLYEYEKGLFAGGRFVIWLNKGDILAEHTIYGSGVPIIRSERGNLELVQ